MLFVLLNYTRQPGQLSGLFTVHLICKNSIRDECTLAEATQNCHNTVG